MGQEADAALVTRLEMRIAAFEQTLAKAVKGAYGAASQITKAFSAANDNVVVSNKKVQRSFIENSKTISAEMKAAASSIAAAFTLNEIKSLADDYTRFTNQLKVAGVEGNQLSTVQNDLYAIAQRYGAELESLGTLYGRLSASSKDLGASNADLLRFTEGVSAALKIQGGDAGAASGALLQLSQALGGGVVRAEEFNSVIEGARPIAQAVADNIDRFGGSVSKLRTEVAAGKVTSAEFFRAFLAGSAALEQQATNANLTIASSYQILRNALAKYIGEEDAGRGGTLALSNAIRALADNLDVIIPALALIAATMAGRYVGGMAAASLANVTFTGTAITAAGAARAMGGALLAAFGGPVGLAITALTVGITAVALSQRDATQASQTLGATSKNTSDAISKLNAILREDPSQGVAKNARDLAKARIEQAGATYEAAKAEIALRKSQAEARFRDLEDGKVREKTGPRGIYQERTLSTFQTRAGSELARARLQAEAAVVQTQRDLEELNKTYQTTIKAIKAGKGSAGAGTTVTAGRATKTEDAKAKAIADGRYAAGAVNRPGVQSIDVQSVDDVQPVFVASGGLHTSDVKPQISESAKDALEKADAALNAYQSRVYQSTYGSIRAGLGAAFGESGDVLEAFGRQLQSALLDKLAAIFTAAAVGSNGQGGGFLATFAGFFANGGSIPSGKFGIAGEGGKPEIVAGPATVLSHNNSLKALRNVGAVKAQQSIVYASTPLHFDLRGAVMTDDLLRRMNDIGQQAAVAGAVKGAQMARQGLGAGLQQYQDLGR